MIGHRKLHLITACLGGILMLSGCQTTGSSGTAANAALPPGTQSATPASEVPANHARFAGIWHGAWGGSLDSKLAVTRVEADGTVDAIYAWGESPGQFEGGYSIARGKIAGNRLTLEPIGSGANISYEMQSNGSLHGLYVRGNSRATGVFVKTGSLGT